MKQVSLYRKYRPRHFSEVCGQDLLINLLKNSIINEKISHSYIFAGERGTGKTTTARIFAKAVNCIDLQQGEPCDHCENCVSINDDSFMDIVEIDAASNNSVDEIRELRERVYYLPAKGKYKVYIIDEAHMITTQGFNAFLKTLEEPPDHVIFILATTEPEKILKTIHSRCQRFSFNKIEPRKIRNHITQIAEKEGFHINSEAALNIALSADGSIRDSLTILQEVIFYSTTKEIDENIVRNALGFITENEINQIFTMLTNPENVTRLLDFTETLFQQRITLDSVLNALFIRLSDMLRSPDMLSGNNETGLNLTQIVELSRYLMNSIKDLRNVKDENIYLKIVFFDMFNILHSKINLQASIPDGRRKNSVVKAPEKVKKVDPEVELVKKKKEPVEIQTPQKEPVADVKNDSDDQLDETEIGIEDWEALMQSLRKQFPLLHALMREASHYERKGNTILVEFPAEMKFHKTSLDKPENKIKIRKVLNDFYQADIEPMFKNQGSGENEDWKDEENDVLLEQAKNMPAVKNIMKLFGGGKVVSVKKLDKLEDNEDG